MQIVLDVYFVVGMQTGLFELGYGKLVCALSKFFRIIPNG